MDSKIFIDKKIILFKIEINKSVIGSFQEIFNQGLKEMDLKLFDFKLNRKFNK